MKAALERIASGFDAAIEDVVILPATQTEYVSWLAREANGGDRFSISEASIFVKWACSRENFDSLRHAIQAYLTTLQDNGQ